MRFFVWLMFYEGTFSPQPPNTKFPKTVRPEGLQDGLPRPGRRGCKGDLAHQEQLDRIVIESRSKSSASKKERVKTPEKRFLPCH